MKSARIFCLALLPCLLAACFSNVSTMRRSSHLYKASYDQVWTASVRAVSASGLVVQSSDKDGGIIVAEGGRNPLLHHNAPQLTVFISKVGDQVEVESTAAVSGQFYDYGANSSNSSSFFRHLDQQLRHLQRD